MCMWLCELLFFPQRFISIKQHVHVDFRSMFGWLLWLKASPWTSVWMSRVIHCDMGAFTPELHRITSNYIHSHGMCLQHSHPEFMWVPGGFVCACGSAGAGCGSDSIRINTRQTKFVHKKHCLLQHNSLGDRQSQIVADKINTAHRYE